MPVSLNSQLGSKEQADAHLAQAIMSAMRVSIPGIIQSFDPEAVTAFKISRSFSCITEGSNEWGTYRSGIVATPYCMVRVSSETQGDHHYAYADFVYDGTHYSRQWRRDISALGLSVLANKFVREVMENLA